MTVRVHHVHGKVNLSILLKRLQLLLYSLNKYLSSFLTNSGSENSWKYDCKSLIVFYFAIFQQM